MGVYCQMGLLTYDARKAQVNLDGIPAPILFSEVRDAIAYLFMPEQSRPVVATYLQDMARAPSWAEPTGWTGVREVVYVIGSDRMRGMDAPEFVPFSDPDNARVFIAEHGGAMHRFEEIAAEDVLRIDPARDPGRDADMPDRLKALSGSIGSN